MASCRSLRRRAVIRNNRHRESTTNQTPFPFATRTDPAADQLRISCGSAQTAQHSFPQRILLLSFCLSANHLDIPLRLPQKKKKKNASLRRIRFGDNQLYYSLTIAHSLQSILSPSVASHISGHNYSPVSVLPPTPAPYIPFDSCYSRFTARSNPVTHCFHHGRQSKMGKATSSQLL